MTTTNGLIEEAFQQFRDTGEICGLLAAADYLDESERLPELARELRRLSLPIHRARVRFFARYATYNYDPKRESQTEGRLHCAIELANAEQWANDAGVEYEWEDDHEANAEYSTTDDYSHYVCIAWCEDASTSLSGIGIEGWPANDPYARVVMAELALELRSMSKQ